MKKIIVASLMMLAAIFTLPAKATSASELHAIAAVKGGAMYDCPVVQVGQLISSYMTGVKWTAKTLDSGITQVVATGSLKRKSHGETIVHVYVFALNNDEFVPTAMRVLYADGAPISEWMDGAEASDVLYEMCNGMVGAPPQI